MTSEWLGPLDAAQDRARFKDLLQRDPLIRKFTVTTDVMADGRIVQDVTDFTGAVMRQVVATQEIQIREALIKLGWTPPPGEHQ